MTKKQIKAERVAIQRLIRQTNKDLIAKIKAEHRQLITALHWNFPDARLTGDRHLLDLSIYDGLEDDLPYEATLRAEITELEKEKKRLGVNTDSW